MKKKIIGLLVICSFSALAGNNSVCSLVDQREFSYISQIGRLTSTQDPKNHCTATLVSKNCIITAGHCKNLFKVIEFNVPHTINFIPQRSRPQDQYLINQSSIVSPLKAGQYEKEKDWAVMKVERNLHTGKFPGEIQGYMKVININQLSRSDIFYISGYGVSSDGSRSHSQQFHTGYMWEVIPGISELRYTIDTSSSASGSSVVLLRTNEIVGIHTNGGCKHREGYPEGYNSGVSLIHNQQLRLAVKKCIQNL